MMFGERKRELERKNRGLGEIFEIVKTGTAVGGDRYAHLKPHLTQQKLELEQAEAIGERWGECQAAIMVFGKAPHKINETARQLAKGMHQAGMGVVTESVNLPDAYRTMLPAGKHFSIRNMDLNCSQFGATTMIYRSSEGQVTVDDLRGEEAQYIFTCTDGNLFHFSPFVGGRAVVICVGPIRTGKSFFRNTVASHFVKYGGFYRAIDIDPGTETLALFFRRDGAIFRIGQNNRGFNNFELAVESNDIGFAMHQKALVVEMLKSNENAGMRTLEPHEQHQLDKAIMATLRLPKKLRRFSAMISHCPSELSQKLNRWYGNGIYASLFDCENDAIGELNKKVVAFNLSEIKGDPVLLPLAMNEIAYRITRTFESPEYRSIPKFLDIDEAHAMLSIKSMRDYIIRNVRTWGKWMGGIGLWSQDPSEFVKIEDWTALRSAASTFIFMPDPTADKDLYKNAFGVTDGELEEIRSIKPKKEAYIIQRDIAVSKKIVVDVEPEQYCINTSRPDEATLRDQLVAKYGIEDGLQKTIEALNLREKETA
jgi:type IV secretion system protein VirB4